MLFIRAIAAVLLALPAADGNEDRPTIVACERAVSAALAKAGVDPASVRVSPQDLTLFESHPPRPPLVDWLFANPLKAPLLASYVKSAFAITWPGDCVDATAQLSRWSGRVVRRGLVGDPLEQQRKRARGDQPVLGALERVFHLGGAALPDEVRAQAAQQLASATADEQTRLAVLMHALCDAHEWASMACSLYDPAVWADILARERKSGAKAEKEDDRPAQIQFAGLQRSADAVLAFDRALPLVGAQEIAFAVDEFVAPYVKSDMAARDGKSKFGASDGRTGEPEAIDAGTMNASDEIANEPTPDPSRWSLVIQTPLGLISVGTEHDLKGQTMAPILLIDWKGDDSYARLAANSAPVQRVSVAIDLAGDDKYVNDDPVQGGFGAGHAGIGMLFDFAGNDTYKIKRNGLADALFGVGILYDFAGDDQYGAIEKAQAHAVAGTALLIDVAGRDRYEIYSEGQGFGGPAGAAALVDRADMDRYNADDADITFPSPQSDRHNVSLAQGAASGWRGDYMQGLSVPGGVGLLLDEQGNDIYSCGVFGQGVGYWLGAGLLIDLGGDDLYTGQWYVQGAAAHFAAGILIEADGSDSYTGTMNMSQGAGHDLSVGALFDLAGSDRHRSGTLSLGAGNASGVGIFVDTADNDSYILEKDAASALGYVTPADAGGIRKVIQGMGLFLDLNGIDGYSATRASNNAIWVSPAATSPGVLPGVARGIDLSEK
ncbi:MAG: hypothetical protein C4547_13615 [Phycisphaerales bacterium]|nr:MAG: hypothetical protein C4547_13615 [Phycisphaerales bacterium]